MKKACKRSADRLLGGVPRSGDYSPLGGHLMVGEAVLECGCFGSYPQHKVDCSTRAWIKDRLYIGILVMRVSKAVPACVKSRACVCQKPCLLWGVKKPA
jgi:hypothetical protein